MDEALGDPSAVRDFVVSALNVLVGSRISESKEGYELETINLSHSLKECLPGQTLPATILVSFDSPTPDGHLYLGRNHPFVEELCRTVLAHSVNRESGVHLHRLLVHRLLNAKKSRSRPRSYFSAVVM